MNVTLFCRYNYSGVKAIAISPNNVVAIPSVMRSIENGNILLAWETEGIEICESLAFSRDGTFLAHGKGQSVYVIDVPQKNIACELRRIHENKICSVSFSPQNHLVTGSWDKCVKVWEIPGGQQLYSTLLTSCVNTVAFSPDGNLIAAGCDNDQVFVLKGNNILSVLTTPKKGVFKVEFSPDGQYLAALYGDEEIIVWQADHLSTPDVVTEIVVRGVKDLAFSPDGQMIAFCCEETTRYHNTTVKEGVLWLCETKNWKILRIVNLDQGASCLSFSPDGRFLAVGCGRGISVWSISE